MEGFVRDPERFVPMPQNVQFDSTIAFQTVNFTTELRNSESNLIVDENGTVQFYAGGWNALGNTENGTASWMLTRIGTIATKAKNAAPT